MPHDAGPRVRVTGAAVSARLQTRTSMFLVIYFGVPYRRHVLFSERPKTTHPNGNRSYSVVLTLAIQRPPSEVEKIVLINGHLSVDLEGRVVYIGPMTLPGTCERQSDGVAHHPPAGCRRRGPCKRPYFQKIKLTDDGTSHQNEITREFEGLSPPPTLFPPASRFEHK